ncbi:radical SAM protein [Patescibacteria group bacterium]|nr:radical SAM protein [Patescibacteria group bacterium]
MLSLYIHVPFCDKKCGYCSFFVVPKEGVDPQGKMIDGYMEGLIRDIQYWGDHYKKPQLRTLYFGGGTPGILGKDKLLHIINTIHEHFDLTYLEELSIELNPNPYEEILDLVHTLNTTYKDIPRIRYSFGIQSFDDSVLNLSGRQYSFAGIQKFLRDLREIKDGRNVFNLDFIAFGK